MSDAPLNSPAYAPFEAYFHYSKNDSGWMIPPVPDDTEQYVWWCDQLILCSICVEPDLFAVTRVYLGTEEDPTFILVAATSAVRPIDITSQTVESTDWGNQAPFVLPISTVLGLWCVTSTTTLGGDSGGSALCTGRLYPVIN